MAGKRQKLTEQLRKLADTVETIRDDGAVVTKGEALAQLVFKRALGYKIEDVKTGEEKYIAPEQWAMQLIFERLEGKVPQTQPDEKDVLKASDKVSELAKSRINHAADAAVSVSEHSSPVDGPPNWTPRAEEPRPESDLES